MLPFRHGVCAIGLAWTLFRRRSGIRKIELVGIAEIAELAEVTKQAVHGWAKHSKDMPKPLARLRCGLIWDAAEIRAWLIKIGFTHLRK